jgi:hypothetical protein
MQRLEAVCRDLENGADIGCRGDARSPTVSSNASSAYDCGAEVTDAVAGWVEDGIAAGPFDPALRPSNAKVNGVMCRIKPNGTARIILNMSAPKGKSVNDGINADDFPTSMSSTSKWIEVLDRAGKNATMATRVSNDGAILADELSKGRFLAFKSKLPQGWVVRQEPAWIPPSILAWIAVPSPDHELGDKILRDIARKPISKST